MTIGLYGSGSYGSDPFGSIPAQIGVLNAIALNGTHVQVNFTEALDFSLPAILDPANYTLLGPPFRAIHGPPATVISVEEASGNAVLLTTTPQQNFTYTVVVTQARSVFGTILDPIQNSATFTGFPLALGFFAVATAATRVRVVFAATMLNDSNLSNPANYTITDFNGNAVFVISATPEQGINPVSVVLVLSTALAETTSYVCTVSQNIHTSAGLTVLPPTSVFQWVAGSNQFQVPLNAFSGEVPSLLSFTNFGGLVYFSPALNTPTANSIIQVEEIDVCSTAYDTYVMPAPIDPLPLFTYGGGIVPTPNPDPYLLNQCVLWAPFPRNFEAQIILGYTGETNQDIFEPPVDTSCSVIIKDQFAYGYVAFLNDPAYYLLPKSTPPEPVPPMFITANNLAPIPPGRETILVLRVALAGSSSFAPAPAKVMAHTGAALYGNSQLFAGAGPPPVVLAQAALSAGSTMAAEARENYGASTNITGQAYVRALASGVNPPPLNQAVLVGYATVNAFGTVHRVVRASPIATATLTATAHATRGAAAHPMASAAVDATATAKWVAQAALQGTSAVVAHATVTHKAEAFPVGAATLSATAS
jgi:hypothetical protein